MTVRFTMANLITRVRVLINDPGGVSQIFDDQTIQDIMDEGRVDVVNGSMIAKPTYTGSTIQFLNYYTDLGGWEDDYVIKQYLTTTVTPSSAEPIAGHFTFAQTTLPPLYITGKLHDVYRAAADVLERWAAKWVLSYSVNVDGQSIQRGQAATALQALAKTYRQKQRPGSIIATRGDLSGAQQNMDNVLAAHEIDYMSSGDGR